MIKLTAEDYHFPQQLGGKKNAILPSREDREGTGLFLQ